MPFDGDWEEAAARLGTVQEFEVLSYDKKAKQIVLENWMDSDNDDELDDDLRVDLPKDRKRAN